MQDFRKRRNLKQEIMRMAIGCFGIVVLAALAFVAVRAAWGMYTKFAAASDAQAEAEVQLATLKDQYAHVDSEVAALQSPRGVEAGVRERYGVAKPGEGEIEIVRDHAAVTSTEGEPKGWWAKLWHAVFVW